LTEKDKRNALAKYRIKQAEESLEEAKFLLDGNKSPRSVINRVYYAMFYCVLALVIYEPYSSSKHSGILSYFNKHFIKEGIFDKEFGKFLNRAYELRQREDYREYTTVTLEQVKPFIEKAESFIKAVKDHLVQHKGIS
jgi:uncharacterized protein (UPF0332 family)